VPTYYLKGSLICSSLAPFPGLLNFAAFRNVFCLLSTLFAAAFVLSSRDGVQEPKGLKNAAMKNYTSVYTLLGYSLYNDEICNAVIDLFRISMLFTFSRCGIFVLPPKLPNAHCPPNRDEPSEKTCPLCSEDWPLERLKRSNNENILLFYDSRMLIRITQKRKGEIMGNAVR
jgi:hypothetical protein